MTVQSKNILSAQGKECESIKKPSMIAMSRKYFLSGFLLILMAIYYLSFWVFIVDLISHVSSLDNFLYSYTAND